MHLHAACSCATPLIGCQGADVGLAAAPIHPAKATFLQKKYIILAQAPPAHEALPSALDACLTPHLGLNCALDTWITPHLGLKCALGAWITAHPGLNCAQTQVDSLG